MPLDIKKHQQAFFAQAQKDLQKSLNILSELREITSAELDRENAEKLRTLYRCFHSMNGTAGMLKLKKISNTAKPVADQLENIIKKEILPNSNVLKEIKVAAKNILQLIAITSPA